MRRASALILLTLLTGCADGPSTRQPSAVPAPSVARARVSMDVADRSASEVLRAIGGVVGRPISVGPRIQGRVSLRLREVPWDLAFDAIVTAVDGVAVWERTHGVAVTKDAGGGTPFAPLAGEPPPVFRRGVRRAGSAPGPVVDLDLGPADLSEVLRAISAQAKVPIVVSEELAETVHLRLEEVPWREAVELVAHLARCEVAPLVADGLAGVRVGRLAPVGVQLTDVPVRRLLELFARYARLNLVIAPGVTGTLTVDLRQVEGWTWVGLLEAAVRAAGLRAGRKGDLVLVSARNTGWGDSDLDGRKVRRAPRPRPTPSNSRLQARSVPAETWLLLLAARAGRDVMLRGEIRGTIDGDTRGLDPHSAFLRAAMKHVVRVTEEGTLSRLVPPGRLMVRARSWKPARVILAAELFAIQATAVDRGTDAPPDVAVISGRIYEVGDQLRDARGRSLPVALAAIEEDRVAFLVHGRHRVEAAFPPAEDED